MTNKELFYFTGKCLILDQHMGFRQEIIEKIEADSINWLKFVNICSNHLILPVIYLKFKSNDLIKYLPEELSEFLKEVYELNLARNNQILVQLHEVTTILNKDNIYPIFLKGSGNLLDQLYSDNGERILGDIDFIVSPRDYLLTANLLEKEGYSLALPFYGEIENLKHYPGIAKSGYLANLEIHQAPVNERYKSWFNFEIIDQGKRSVKSLPGCFVLSDKHNIILNFIHGQLDHEGQLYGIVSFRDLYDLYLLSKRMPLDQTLNDIKRPQKAIAYYIFAGKAFGLYERFYSGRNLSAWLFERKHNLNMGSKFFYNTHRSIIYISKRLFIGYIGQFIKLLYSKNLRKSIIKRLIIREWYSYHLQGYKNFFIKKK
jgi:hypothetical protein